MALPLWSSGHKHERRAAFVMRILCEATTRAPSNIVINEYFDGNGAVVYKYACKLGCEGIVSKRIGLLYRSGRSKHWLKVKNPAAPAVRETLRCVWCR